jgi:GTP cyclohydrolase I
LPDSVAVSFVDVATGAGLEESPEQAAERLNKMQNALRTLLECVGEDPTRPGLLNTPERYAKALLYFTGGYRQNI